jgi:hypothetical protein
MINENKTTPDIFANLIGGPDLCVYDWNDWMDIHHHIIDHCKEIKGLAHYLLYVDFVLEQSGGFINRPQLHDRETISKVMQLSGNNLSRYERQWIADGWLLKHKGGGRYTSMRALGHQFDHVRTQWLKSELIRKLTQVPFQKLRLLPKS